MINHHYLLIFRKINNLQNHQIPIKILMNTESDHLIINQISI